jgi:non-specific serine/threonine protein kinase
MSADTLAHYRLQERLGAGAMGEVYRAEDLRLHRTVALKMLPPGSDDDAAQRLLREARVASSLSHPSIAVVYEVGEVEHEGRLRGFIAMEFVSGRTLAEILRDGPLPAADVLSLARQIGEALLEAHDRGIVHRDVKPSNIMVSERGRVKVLDFGVAKYAPPVRDDDSTWSGRHAALDGAGAVVGTLAYMSPEQARGGDVDARSDVFSVGALLYEMLSGRAAFAGANAVETLEKVLREDPPPLPAGSRIEAGLAPLVARMLAKDRDARPGGMREVLHALEAVAAGAVSERPVEDVRKVAVLSFTNITRNPEDDWLGTGIAEAVGVGLGDLRGIAVLPRERVVEMLRAVGPHASEATLAVRVGAELGARYVIDGGYQSVGEPLRVTARVVDGCSGDVVQTLKVDGRRSGLFDLQDRLVADLAAALRSGLPAETARGEDTHSLQAYEAHAKGLLNLRTETQESLDRAIVFFQKAVALDPGFARAHMHLGAAFDWKGNYLGMPDVIERGVQSLERALALLPESGEAWRHMGVALVDLGRGDEAVAAFERALSANPTDAAAYSGLARVHFILRGDFASAVLAYEKALTLNPQAGWSALQLAHCATYLRDLRKAEAAARRAVVLQRELRSGRTGLVIVGAFIRLGAIFALQGRPQEALAEYDRELEFLRDVDHALRGRIVIELHQRRGEAQLQAGEADAGRASLDLALEAFARRLRNGADDAATRYYAACAYALQGDVEAALASLEKAAQVHPRLTAARAPLEPALAGLKGQPRFQALVGSR